MSVEFDHTRHKIVAIGEDGSHVHVTVADLAKETREVEKITQVVGHVPTEITARIDALEDMARAWADAHAVILRHVDELRQQNEILRHAVNVLNDAPPYHTHDNHQMFEGFADIGGQHYPVTIRMRSAA